MSDAAYLHDCSVVRNRPGGGARESQMGNVGLGISRSCTSGPRTYTTWGKTMVFGDLLALFGLGLLALVFLWMAHEARLKHLSIEGYLLGNRIATRHDFGPSMVAASTSLDSGRPPNARSARNELPCSEME